MKALLIQGLFFQWQDGVGIAYSHEGAIPVIQQAMVRSHFAGAIWEDPESGKLEGNLTDHYGDSTLFDIEISETELSFVKRYVQRPQSDFHAIHYKFEKHGTDWVGGYNGEATGDGMARCIITEVTEDFFDPRSVATILNKPEALLPPDIG